jgi:hypothetical protein
MAKNLCPLFGEGKCKIYRSEKPTRAPSEAPRGCQLCVCLDAIIKFLNPYYQATSVTDAQRRVQDLIESSLAALRVNVHSALNTNAKIIADWKELVERFGPATK